jgi:hypothetical protein
MREIVKLFSTLPKPVKDSARAAEPPVPRKRAKDKSRGPAAETDRCALGQCRSQSATEAAAGRDRAPRSGSARGLLKIHENIFFLDSADIKALRANQNLERPDRPSAAGNPPLPRDLPRSARPQLPAVQSLCWTKKGPESRKISVKENL